MPEYIGGMRKDDRNTSTTSAGDLFLHNSTRGLCQLIYEMEMSIQRRSKQGPVTDRNDNGPSGGPKDLLGQALKKARADQTPTVDGGDAGDGKDGAVEATTKKRPAKPSKPAKPAPKKRKVRISVENLPKVLQTKKRASVKARRSSNAARRSSIPARGSFITIRRSSIAKRKSSIARKSNSGDASPPNPKPFACLVYGCSYAGARKQYLGAHMKKHAKDKLVDCKMCDMQFKTGDAIQLAKHVAEHKSK